MAHILNRPCLSTQAQRNVEAVCANGLTITLYKRSDADDEDGYGEITTGESKSFKAFPVRFSPFNRKVLNTVEWAASVDVIAYISKLAASKLGVDLQDLRDYAYMEIQDRRYAITQVAQANNVGTDFLYYVIGGRADGSAA